MATATQTDIEADKRNLETCGELELYLRIEMMGGFVWRMNHDMSHDRIPKEDHPAINEDVARVQQLLEYGCSQTARFGVGEAFVMRHSSFLDREVRTASDEYWLWYRWWDAWCKALSNENYRAMDSDMCNHADLSKWRPAGTWKS